jgi:hypothetical protein
MAQISTINLSQREAKLLGQITQKSDDSFQGPARPAYRNAEERCRLVVG